MTLALMPRAASAALMAAVRPTASSAEWTRSVIRANSPS
jgi:hypothetical protein